MANDVLDISNQELRMQSATWKDILICLKRRDFSELVEGVRHDYSGRAVFPVTRFE